MIQALDVHIVKNITDWTKPQKFNTVNIFYMNNFLYENFLIYDMLRSLIFTCTKVKNCNGEENSTEEGESLQVVRVEFGIAVFKAP